MRDRNIYFLGALLIGCFVITGFFGQEENLNDDFSKRVKVSLREVGNQLLLKNNDSTSLVRPIIDLGEDTFELSFESELSILPDDAVSVIRKNFEKAGFPEQYRVEVIECESVEVGYSYEVHLWEERTIIPCSGRQLPRQCYRIQVKFLKEMASESNNKMYLALAALLAALLMGFYFFRRKKEIQTREASQGYSALGSFRFYPEQNKLVKEAEEISLSKKECELLAIFASRPNQIIKRDELSKRVWEDNGVIVGRSLDTYISKLRKKLQDDSSIQIINVHGVGYKLELGK